VPDNFVRLTGDSQRKYRSQYRYYYPVNDVIGFIYLHCCSASRYYVSVRLSSPHTSFVAELHDTVQEALRMQRDRATRHEYEIELEIAIGE